MEEARVVLITAPDLGVAQSLAQELVESRAAACVNLLPGITSIYRWRGAVEHASEVLLVLKTTARRLPDVEAILTRSHPYEVPECVAIEPARLAPKYRAWLEAECGQEPRAP